jgi:diaminohydroxyphosphoribosylaminopyrimidine deaminase/5-amino-6-(5-phosphoribosylamino)uracil reductase
VEVLMLPNPHGKVDLPELVRELGRRGMNEVHVEAGARLNGSLLREGCVDELLVYVAPSIVGDTGLGMFSLPEITDLAQKIPLSIREVSRVGEDIRVIARV